MKRMFLMMAGFLLCTGPASAEQSKCQRLAEQLIEAMDMRASLEESFKMVKQTVPLQMQQNMTMMGLSADTAESQKHMNRILSIVEEEMNYDKVKDDFVNLYASSFDEKELQSLITFYKSPAGQAFVKKQPELIKKSMEINQKLMTRLMPRIQAEIMAEAGSKAPPAKKK